MIKLDILRPNTAIEQIASLLQSFAITGEAAAKAMTEIGKPMRDLFETWERRMAAERFRRAGWWAIGGLP